MLQLLCIEFPLLVVAVGRLWGVKLALGVPFVTHGKCKVLATAVMENDTFTSPLAR